MSEASPSTPRSAGAGPPDAPAVGPPPALLRALRRLLAPLVRLLLEHQITFPVLAGLLKSVYVEQASRHLGIPGRPQTLSRLSLLTGIHRKDVKRLRAEPRETRTTPANVSLGAQLVLRWTSEPEYLDEAGRPRPLPRLASDGDAASFESLVESVTSDLRPRAILDEWLRLGIARLEDGRVCLATDAFVPSQGFDEKAWYLGRNVHDHIATARHNLLAREPAMLERSVYYAGLRPESVATLEALAEQAGMAALQSVNKRARALQKADGGRPDAGERMSFGVYFHRAPLESESGDEQDPVDEGHDDPEGGSDARAAHDAR